MPVQRSHSQTHPPQVLVPPQPLVPPQSVPAEFMAYELNSDRMYKRRCRALKALAREMEDENNLIAYKIAQSRRRILAAKEKSWAPNTADRRRSVVPTATPVTVPVKSADIHPKLPSPSHLDNQYPEKPALPQPSPPPPPTLFTATPDIPSDTKAIDPVAIFNPTALSTLPKPKKQSGFRVAPLAIPDGRTVNFFLEKAPPRGGRLAARKVSDKGGGPSAPRASVINKNGAARWEENGPLPSVLRDQAVDRHAPPKPGENGEIVFPMRPGAITTQAAPSIDKKRGTRLPPAIHLARSEEIPTGWSEGQRDELSPSEADGDPLVDDY